MAIEAITGVLLVFLQVISQRPAATGSLHFRCHAMTPGGHALHLLPLSLCQCTPSPLPVRPLEKPPPNKHNHHKRQPPNRPILLQQQLPINPHRCLLIFPTILPQPTAQISHPLQAIPPIQQILNILRHDFRHIAQLVIQLVQVLRCAGVLIGFLGALDEGVEFDEGVGAA